MHDAIMHVNYHGRLELSRRSQIGYWLAV